MPGVSAAGCAAGVLSGGSVGASGSIVGVIGIGGERAVTENFVGDLAAVVGVPGDLVAGGLVGMPGDHVTDTIVTGGVPGAPGLVGSWGRWRRGRGAPEFQGIGGERVVTEGIAGMPGGLVVGGAAGVMCGGFVNMSWGFI